MHSSLIFCNSISLISIIPSSNITSKPSITLSNSMTFPSIHLRRFPATQIPQILRYNSTPISKINTAQNSRVLLNTLELLEWDKLCNIVASFAQTPFGRDACKGQLSRFDQTYDESITLLKETRAAVEINKFNRRLLNFDRVNVKQVKSAVDHVRAEYPVDGHEAIAVANLLQFTQALKIKFKELIKENPDFCELFKPLDELILDWNTNKSLVRSIVEVVDECGSIKDSASTKLKQARRRVDHLDGELYRLTSSLIAKERKVASSLKAAKNQGRWCILSGTSQLQSTMGLLISSGESMWNIIEPVRVMPLNDELEIAEAYVAEVEAELLESLTKKIEDDLDGIQKLLKCIIELDVVNARAIYSISMGGTFPDLLVLDGENAPLGLETFPTKDYSPKLHCPSKKQWKLHLLKAYHPLLIKRHQDKLQEARKNVAWFTSMGLERYHQFRKKNLQREGKFVDPQILKDKVSQLEKAHPSPVDFVIDKDARVVLISGPNTGGKTVCLKTLGLAAFMAKAGLYVLCSAPAQIPWFDHIFADIGDQQSLSYSVSTFSGHLRQINDIRAKSTSQSLVLLDEIGAGTNPHEGSALGMSILESFSVSGARLTVAATHHGELKVLKYCHEAFENACMEFDDVNMRPTYKIIWGIPGRSNAINIAERLGLLETIVTNARSLYGADSSEIDKSLYKLERLMKDVEEYVNKARHYSLLCNELHEKLLLAKRKLSEAHGNLRYRKMQQIYEIKSTAQSRLHKKMQEYRAFAYQMSEPTLPSGTVQNASTTPVTNQQLAEANYNCMFIVGTQFDYFNMIPLCR